jgi:hypothetical protein
VERDMASRRASRMERSKPFTEKTSLEVISQN